MGERLLHPMRAWLRTGSSGVLSVACRAGSAVGVACMLMICAACGSSLHEPGFAITLLRFDKVW